MTPFPNESVPASAPTPETLRAAALAARDARRQAEQERRLAEARAEFPKRTAEYLGGLSITPDMLDGDELVVGDLRFRLAPSGGLLALLPCSDAPGLCAHEFADLADLGELLGE
jgi:hypothetical protein